MTTYRNSGTVGSGSQIVTVASDVVNTPAGDIEATDVQAAINELDTEKLALSGGDLTGALGTTSTIDGRDVAADGAILDSIIDKVVQVVNYQTGAVATGTTLIANDDTIPQNTEGDEYMTLAITPKDAANKLKIDIVANLSSSVSQVWLTAALFQDATAGALASSIQYETQVTALGGVQFIYYMTAGTISSTTFKVRAGTEAAGTTTFNGAGGGRLHGGVLTSSITITELTS